MRQSESLSTQGVHGFYARVRTALQNQIYESTGSVCARMLYRLRYNCLLLLQYLRRACRECIRTRGVLYSVALTENNRAQRRKRERNERVYGKRANYSKRRARYLVDCEVSRCASTSFIR
jgi:hypothetical protein